MGAKKNKGQPLQIIVVEHLNRKEHYEKAGN
jgi:hypothetical protein